ncbi:MarR family winged helix-turn-helix transcriptional regulator [Rubinisphaera sp. JC750]|uniref:MarR family winged helix-turn-helix transcriptional regulator n=1 Tax=Rubinisphaera sp. JC750 TaxID=2898658 RepID=UPI001F48758B|nr:MarR family transcriptional regulator [Rubinisphaera sp. JC750]
MKKTLQHELKRKQPFDRPEQEAILNIMKTSDQLQNRYGRLFRQFDLTSSQYNVLRILRGEGRPLPSLEIADRMIQVVPAITGLIDRLEKRELVVRRRCEEDRRVVFVEITQAGIALVEQLDLPVQELETELFGHLQERELKQLTRLLEKARTSMT